LIVGFLIGKFELTQGEWYYVMGTYPSRFDGTGDWDGNPVNPPEHRDLLPVEQVSWDDIQEFEKKTGLRLPTEAQWEFACRGGTETAFSFGSGESCADWECAPCAERDPHMWYCANSARRTQEVGTREANPFGLHDLHGNVFEWVEDEYREDFYRGPGATGPDPLCTSGSVIRGIRGAAGTAALGAAAPPAAAGAAAGSAASSWASDPQRRYRER
jgi:formylglycine-generating enzyme required for sulfatase activity